MDLRSGAVKSVATGVALKYHSPGCGTGDTAEFTINPGDNQRRTQVLTVDMPKGKIEHSVTVDGQVTSVVPTKDGPVGVLGGSLVRLPRKGPASGRPVEVAKTGGLAYDLRPEAGGGVDLAVQLAAGKSSQIMRERSGKLSRLGEGNHTDLQLLQGRAGHAIAVGASRTASTSGLHKVSTRGLPNGATGVSLDGGAVMGLGAKTDQSAPLILAGHSGKLLKRKAAGASKRPSTSLPAPAPKAAGGTSAAKSAYSIGSASQAASPGIEPASLRTATADTTAVAPAAATTVSSTTPKCSVGRNEENRQVMQPGTAQVSWAAQMAEQGR
ncbi:hypothetical protein [Streptomyces sp. TRM68367]|uniref:hypothetical protein n=1 Tax=Streptomyces sp. TRM68367 TaxID=2758415 RepID=UPI001CA808D1|nr:hypothetical protein [Streptomyces sp. TRM68367]